MSFCVNCGNKHTEGAKYCTNCDATVTPFKGESQTQRNTVYDGEIHKCPNCGELLDAFTSRCPACGYELRGAKATCSVQQFYFDINHATSVEQKTTLIRNFPIPNTKEDIMEFMILAASNFNADSYISEQGQEKELSEAWLAKFEQSYQKASLLFRHDPDFATIQELYDNGKETIDDAADKKKTKTQLGLLLRNIAVCIGVIVLIAAVFVDRTGGNALMIELIGYIVLIASAATLSKREASMIDFAVGAVSGLFTLLVSVFLDNGSMALLGGGIILIIIAVNFFKSIGKKQ